MKRVVLWLSVVVSVAVCLLGGSLVYAQQSSSTHYQVNEVFFGTGGELNACSGSYCAKQSAGETGVGKTTSTNYQAQGGFNTDRAPSLTLIVTNTNTDLGMLSSSSTATTTGSFSVKSYLAGGYVVQNQSDPPKSSGSNAHTLTALTSQTGPTVGTEQFGINLVANTSPVAFGAYPSQQPDASFSFGAAATGYNMVNQFKYVKGDTIASSSKSSGQTNYTISYIFNMSNLTPAGTYNFNHVIVATSTY